MFKFFKIAFYIKGKRQKIRN